MRLVSTQRASGAGLGARAAAVGWQKAWFEFNVERVRRGEPLAEDDRVADWTLLLSLKNGATSLVIGCEWATAALTLAMRCARLSAVDGSVEKIEFLKIRAAQQNVTNINAVYAPPRMPALFEGGPFDLIVVRDIPEGWPISLSHLIETLRENLKPGGVLSVSVSNTWCPLSGASRSAPGRFPENSMIGCRRQLARAGFDSVQVYGPLPHHWGVSLFHIPLDEPAPIGFFFKSIFPLFNAVSPEVKRGFALELVLAKIAARAAGLPGAARLIKYFLPGYQFIAKLRSQDLNAA